MFKLPSSEFIPKFLSNIESWHGHVFFVRDLVHNMCPSIIVELGVHKGDSLLSMAQSCIESNLETKLYGIDHWEGDSQAGHFDSEVYNYVEGIKNRDFNQLKLIKSTFDNAISQFENGSIDILHIDGFHSYEASKNDFFRWLPKVKNEGVILIHDIASQNKNFGVVNLWKEIKESFYVIEFEHSQGLGVVIKNGLSTKNPFLKRLLVPCYMEYFNKYYSLLSTLLRLNRLTFEAKHPFETQMFGSESKSIKSALLEIKKHIFLPRYLIKLLYLWKRN